MNIVTKRCIDLVKYYEGCRLEAYKDEVGVWTIGYGITNSDYKVTNTKIDKGVRIDRETALKWLVEALNVKYLPFVMKYDSVYHWNQNEIDALVSFAYNLGSINLLTQNGKRTKEQIADKMLQYIKAGGKEYLGLVRRRKSEHDLFVKPYVPHIYEEDVFPKLPKRRYFVIGDTSIEVMLVQKLINWSCICNTRLKEDGIYGKETFNHVAEIQNHFDLPVNGKFGNLCLESLKKFKR